MLPPIIEIKYLSPRNYNLLPEYKTKGSAAFDLRANILNPLILKSGQCKLIGTGVAIYIRDPGFAGIILPRSGLGHKKGLILGNSVGLIDSDYQGELLISTWNRSDTPIIINPLMRFAQLAIIRITQVNFVAVNDFSNHSHRQSNGFGHTGVK